MIDVQPHSTPRFPIIQTKHNDYESSERHCVNGRMKTRPDDD